MSLITQLFLGYALHERKLSAHSQLLFLSYEGVGGIYQMLQYVSLSPAHLHRFCRVSNTFAKLKTSI